MQRVGLPKAPGYLGTWQPTAWDKGPHYPTTLLLPSGSRLDPRLDGLDSFFLSTCRDIETAGLVVTASKQTPPCELEKDQSYLIEYHGETLDPSKTHRSSPSPPSGSYLGARLELQLDWARYYKVKSNLDCISIVTVFRFCCKRNGYFMELSGGLREDWQR